MDDIKVLVKRAQSGDEDAFGELVVMHHRKVYAVLYRIVGNEDEAQELAQKTWVKVWKKLNTFKGKSAFFTWVYRVATYTALDSLRVKKRRLEVEYLDELDVMEFSADAAPLSARASCPDKELLKDEMMRRFESALDTLSDKHRTALVLREIEGLSYEEISRAMDCKVGTVMSRIFTARKSIREHMKDLLE